MKKRILCFGDSNTYGYDPRGGRYDEDTRWPTRLGKLLGDDYTVIEEGFGGRTCVFDDPTEGGFKSGAAYLPPCLMSHNPLDLVMIMLGTNDTKRRFGMSPMTIGDGMMQLVRLTRWYGADAQGQPPRVMIVAPAPISEAVRRARFAECFGPDAPEVSRGLAAEFRRISRLLRCDFLDAGAWAEPSEADGVHLTAEAHARLAEGARRAVLEALGQQLP